MPSESFLKCFREQNKAFLIKIAQKCPEKLNFSANKIIGTCATKDYNFIVDNLQDRLKLLDTLLKKTSVYIVDNSMIKFA